MTTITLIDFNRERELKGESPTLQRFELDGLVTLKYEGLWLHGDRDIEHIGTYFSSTLDVSGYSDGWMVTIEGESFGLFSDIQIALS